MSFNSREREIIPVSYAARAKNTPDEPAISVLSRAKKAAARGAAPFMPSTASSDFQNYCVALPATGADRGAAVAAAAPAQLVHERAEDARARGADRVTKGNGAAVDVDALLVDAEHADRVERDRGKRLVDLPQVDVTWLQACLLERLLGGARWR